MVSVKDLEMQIEDANALGRQNLTDKGVEILESATTYEIMSKIAEVSGSGGDISVEYIESAGTHCIDTGYIANQNTRIKCKYQVVGVNGSFDTLFGDNVNFKYSPRFNLSYGGLTQLAKWGGGDGTAFGSALSSSGITVLEVNNGTFTFTENGVTTTQTVNENAEFTSQYSLVLFCDRYYKNLSQCYEQASSCRVRLYYFKIYEGETLVRDFIPARDDSGVICLYDKVTEAYFYNQGSGEFAGGFIEKVGIEPLDHTVTFTVDGEPYEIVSVKSGNAISKPLKDRTKWLDENESKVAFPYYPEEDVTLFGVPNTETLLLHCDDFSDSGLYEHTLTNNGVVIDETIKKFGSGSMLFDTNTDYVEIDKSNFDLANNDFTIDFWAYPTAFTGMILASWGYDTAFSFTVLTSSSGELQFAYGFSKSSSRDATILSSGSYLSLNSWQHVAITRANDTLYFFINGVLVYSVAFSVTILPPVNNIWIGKNADTGRNPYDRYSGYLDEIRIINGECEWTENFTPPTEQY